MLAATVLVGLTACGSSSTSGSSSSGADLGLFESGTLTVGSDISYAPQEFYDANQKPTGFDLDIAQAIAKKMGLQYKVINQGFDGIIPALNAKKFDIIVSAMTITDKRKQSVQFVPYFTAGEAFVVKKDGSYMPKQLPDLCGHSVAVEKGTAEADEVATVKCSDGKAPNSQTYATDTEAAEQISKGAVDVYFTDSPVAAYDVQRKSDLAQSSDVFETAPEGIAVRKDNTALFNAVQKAFNDIKADGEYKAILAKWNVSSGAV
ncbi:MAG: ABC transporter substrate-binding protein [Candidatus Dormibacteria bacterium]